MKILLVEDDHTLNQNICEALHASGYATQSVYDGNLADRILRKENFDCVILDISLPGKNGFDICKTLREYNRETPVLMLTAFGELEDKVQGYDSGADDYLTKPFYMRELILRIQSLLKRNQKTGQVSDTIVSGSIKIQLKNKKVFREGVEVSLTPREFQILVKLLENKGELVSKNQLIQEIWGNFIDTNTNTIEVYINFLRNKLDKPFGKSSIKTKVGYGYYFEEQDGH